MLIPLVAEWASFTLSPTEFIADGATVVSLGRFTCTHKTTGKHADAGYAHIVERQRRQDRPIPPIHRHPRDRPTHE